MTFFQIGVNRRSGLVTIWMETPCGLKPILVCSDLDGVKEFGEMLLNFYNSKKDEKDKVEKISENLLRQALKDSKYFKEELE